MVKRIQEFIIKSIIVSICATGVLCFTITYVLG